MWFACQASLPPIRANAARLPQRLAISKERRGAKWRPWRLTPHPNRRRSSQFIDAEQQPRTLADFKGRTVLVNLWATWCVPCREEMPALDKLQARLGGPAFEVVAINVDTRNADKPKAWLQQNEIRNLAYYADPTGKLLQVLQKSGHVVGLPTTLLVDASGCEIALLKGPAEWASPDAVAFIEAALKP